MIKRLFLFVILFQLSGILWAAEYFVSASGSDDNDGAEATPWKTLNLSINRLSPGDVLNVSDGVYNENLEPVVSGTESALITVRAINPFSVTVNGSGLGHALNISRVSYLVFDGFKLKNAGENAVLQVHSPDGQPASGNMATHHIYLRRISVQGSCKLNNCVALLITRSNDVYLEDSWAYGAGRYTVLLYGTRSVTVRRVVVRWDYWDGALYKPNDPRTALGIYNSHSNIFDNVIVIDSGHRPAGRGGDKNAISIAGGDNGISAPYISSDNNRFYGLILKNNIGLALNLESRALAHNANHIENGVIINNSMSGITINKKVANTVFTHMTVIGQSDAGFTNWSSDPDTVNNSLINSVIINNGGTGIYGGVIDNSNILYNNQPNYPSGKIIGQNSAIVNPQLVFAFSNDTPVLQSRLGSDSKRPGAHLMNRYYSGTETVERLWPWLHENEIYNDMCDPPILLALGRTGGNIPGWCRSGKSLTRYLWNSESSSPCPDNICAADPDPLSFYDDNGLPVILGGALSGITLGIMATWCGVAMSYKCLSKKSKSKTVM